MRDQSIVVKQSIKTVVLFLFSIIINTAAFCQDGNDVSKTQLTTGRLESILISLLGLTSLILSIRKFRASKTSTSNKRTGIIIAASAGVLCIILAAVHIANSTGGFGTGSGKAGAIVAIVLGLTGVIFSAVTLSRLRHSTN